MNIYLCSRYARRDEMRTYYNMLQSNGHICTSRWIVEDDSADPVGGSQMDMADVLRSDAVIAFTETPDVGYMTGGRWVEFGIALGVGVPICIVGPRENIFCHLPSVMQADTIHQAVDKVIAAMT